MVMAMGWLRNRTSRHGGGVPMMMSNRRPRTSTAVSRVCDETDNDTAAAAAAGSMRLLGPVANEATMLKMRIGIDRGAGHAGGAGRLVGRAKDCAAVAPNAVRRAELRLQHLHGEQGRIARRTGATSMGQTPRVGLPGERHQLIRRNVRRVAVAIVRMVWMWVMLPVHEEQVLILSLGDVVLLAVTTLPLLLLPSLLPLLLAVLSTDLVLC